MKHSKLLIAAALSAAAWCSASQAQTVIYDVTEYYGSSTGTTPSESNWTVYPSYPSNMGYSVSRYWDNGVVRERVDPAVVDTQGMRTYVYPETSRYEYQSPTVIYTTPRADLYLDPIYQPRY